MHKFKIISISESHFNSETLKNDDNLNIPGYNMSHADHPSGWVCIHDKKSLPIGISNINFFSNGFVLI